MNRTELTEAAGVQPVVFCCHSYSTASKRLTHILQNKEAGKHWPAGPVLRYDV